MASGSIRVIVADDHPVVSHGVMCELALDPGISVAGSAKDSTDLLSQLETHPCDVVVMDYSMPGGQHGDGLGLISLLRRRHPCVGIIIFTMMDDPSLLRTLVSDRLLSVVGKVDAIRHVIEAVHAMRRGRTYCSPSIKDLVLGDALFNRPARLSKREAEIVRLFCAGATITEISQMSHRSVQTVSSQKRSAMRKLGIERDADLIRYGARVGVDAADMDITSCHT